MYYNNYLMNIFFYDTKIGKVTIGENDGKITLLLFGVRPCESYTEKETPLIKKAYTQLCEYLDGKRQSFDLPLAPCGTEFQKRAWHSLTKIPYGKTWSYKELATDAGNPKASRAVGMANNKNPISIFIPCHRVIGSDGELVGYGGGLDVKKKLLALETD